MPTDRFLSGAAHKLHRPIVWFRFYPSDTRILSGAIARRLAGVTDSTKALKFGSYNAKPGELRLIVAELRRLNSSEGFLAARLIAKLGMDQQRAQPTRAPEFLEAARLEA